MLKDWAACEVADSCGLNNQMGKQAMAAYAAHQSDGNGLATSRRFLSG